MLDKKDAQWWILEAEKHPDTAVDLIRMLADRLAFLDKQNEELRGELTTLRRKSRGDTSDSDSPVLRQRIQELESALRQGGTEQRLLIYAADRLEANTALGKLAEHGLQRELPGDVAMLVCGAAASLLIVTDEAQVFSVSATALPLAEGGPDGTPAMLGNPRNVAAIIDQSVFERCRFLTLLSQGGYVYSVLAGSISQIVKRGDKLIRNLIPGDPILTAIPSYNADLLALSEKGRVTRFPEKAIAGSGSMALELPKGDALVGLIALNADTNLLFLSNDGKLFVRPSSSITRRQGPGTSTGMPFKGQSMFGVLASEDVLILTGRGKLISVRVAELPYRAQTESGVAVPGLAADELDPGVDGKDDLGGVIMRIGMDFGTTNSGIAVYDGERVTVLPLDPVAQTNVMRSVIYMTTEHELHVGQEAIELYNTQNINRERRMVRKKVGRVEMTFAEVGTIATDVHITVDELEPGRLMQSLKSALATPYTGTMIYNKKYTLEELIALYLGEARRRASDLLGEDANEVVLGRPVHFVSAESDEDDARAEDRLRSAAHLAGFTQVDFEFEPVAAAKHYAQSVSTPQTILVYDFGGGTLDLTVMRVAPGKQAEILAIGGVGIAGDRFDQRVVEHTLLPHFGSGITWGDKSLPIPQTLIEQVTAWEGLSALATLENRSFLHKMQEKCSAPVRLYALESLIFNFYGFAMFEAVERAKRTLSDRPFEAFRFVGQDIDIWQMVTRSQFESIIRSEWRQIRSAVIDVVARSGLEPSQIDAVVRTGGSSSIPAFLDMLGELFGPEKLVTEDLFTGVTAGLGITAWERR